MYSNVCRSIQNYGERYQSGTGGFETQAFFRALGDFFGIFTLSLLIGALMGCITAIISFINKIYKGLAFCVVLNGCYVCMFVCAAFSASLT
jgi:hypothetical protein